MKLLIISHTPHYRQGKTIVGLGATVREIDHLATLFESVRHVAFLHPGEAPLSALPYTQEHVELVGVPPAGGKRLRDKLSILWLAPLYIRIILRELPKADVVHVRCPASISLMAIVLMALVRRPRVRWTKYAGNWRPEGHEPLSYRFQRWWLQKGFQGGVVTVNGEWPDQPPHIFSFLNPCLTSEEIAEGAQAAAEKEIGEPIQVLFVGRLEAEKGIGRALRVIERLRRRGLEVAFHVVGDGPARRSFEEQARQAGLAETVRFYGLLPRPELGRFYARAHIMLLPSSGEGWPKVLSEAMAYGVVPVASAVGSIPHYLEKFGTGRAFAPDEIDHYTEAIAWYASHPEAWKQESRRGVEAARLYSYEEYLRAVEGLLEAGAYD